MGSAGKKILSVATGGVSDLIGGDKPFSAVSKDIGNITDAIWNPLSTSIPGLIKGVKEGNYESALQYLIDPITEPGIDAIARTSGKYAGKATPDLVPYMDKAGFTLGNILAPGWGGLVGYEIGNKMQGGAMGQTPEQTAERGVKGGAIIGATNIVGNLVNSALAPSTVAPTTGTTIAEEMASTSPSVVQGAEPIINDVADIATQQAAQNANLSVEPALSSAGELSSAPVGTTDTLEQMIQNTVEGSGNVPTQLTADPIPLGETVANTSGMITDVNPNLSSEILEGAKTLGRYGIKGYNLYNKGKQAYDLIQSLSNLGDTQSIKAITAPQVSSQAPVGSIDEDTLGELMRMKGNKNYGAVLA